MKLIFLGDSITQGAGATVESARYVDRVEKKLNCTALNYGLGGTRIARQKKVSENTLFDLDFRLRLTVADNDCDLIFVFGGTNDYGHGNLVLGSVEDCNEDTFSGQLKLLIDDLIKKYTKQKICFVLPMQRFDEDGVCCKGASGTDKGAPLVEYVNSMSFVAQDEAAGPSLISALAISSSDSPRIHAVTWYLSLLYESYLYLNLILLGRL